MKFGHFNILCLTSLLLCLTTEVFTGWLGGAHTGVEIGPFIIYPAPSGLVLLSALALFFLRCCRWFGSFTGCFR